MSPSPVTVHGVVIDGVSPMKTSKTKSGSASSSGIFSLSS